MDGQQDRSTNSKAARMTDWKHLKLGSAIPMTPNFQECIQFVCSLNARTEGIWENISASLLYFFLFSLTWLADYTERMGVRVCSCCGNGLLFVKGYIPGIWCFCAAIDKNPACRDWWTDRGFCQARQDRGEKKELGGRCVNRRTER